MTLFYFFFWKAEKQFRKSGLSIESVGNNSVVEIGSSNLTVAFFLRINNILSMVT